MEYKSEYECDEKLCGEYVERCLLVNNVRHVAYTAMTIIYKESMRADEPTNNSILSYIYASYAYISKALHGDDELMKIVGGCGVKGKKWMVGKRDVECREVRVWMDDMMVWMGNVYSKIGRYYLIGKYVCDGKNKNNK